MVLVDILLAAGCSPPPRPTLENIRILTWAVAGDTVQNPLASSRGV